ncbi:MAG: pyridoxal 5'-phosphate synthase glutaminase subunit PdxT [Solirubrobacterales bacterium]
MAGASDLAGDVTAVDPSASPGPAGAIGLLALQGGFSAHGRVLESLGVNVREVRAPGDLAGLAALVLPGGESTTMMLGIERESLTAPLAEFVASGKPVLATCAGAIILDDTHLGLLDVTCDRNAYGGQVHSFEADLRVGDAEPFRGVFIRAPRITRVGEGVGALIEHDGESVAVRSGNVLACTFHPELTPDDRIHRLFLSDLSHASVSDINTKRRAA